MINERDLHCFNIPCATFGCKGRKKILTCKYLLKKNARSLPVTQQQFEIHPVNFEK